MHYSLPAVPTSNFSVDAETMLGRCSSLTGVRTVKDILSRKKNYAGTKYGLVSVYPCRKLFHNFLTEGFLRIKSE